MTITAPTPVPQFDVCSTAWATQENLTGGAVFGNWAGANTPSSGLDYAGHPLSETFTGGQAVGMEINAGNRWSDFGLQYHTGGARYTVGLQVVPDVTPAPDGPPSTTYPGTFGVSLAPSARGHRWWTGYLLEQDTIVPGGLGHLEYGGSAAPNAPGAWTQVEGYWGDGRDLSNAAIADFIAIKINQFHGIVGGYFAGTNITASTNASTGAITTLGGAGIAGNINAGGYVAPMSGTVATIAALTSIPVGSPHDGY